MPRMFHHSTNPLLLKLFIALCLFFTPSYTAYLTPYGTNYIVSSICNKQQNSDYTFNFQPTTLIPAGGGLKVVFPTQYTSGLGVSTTPSCSTSCTVTDNTVVFTFTEEILAGQATSVTIQGVMNPTSMGGTGNFQLQTIYGINVLDENLIFDVMGIAGGVGTLTSTLVSISSTGVTNAGETTRYTFSFIVSQLIPAGSYMKFTILDDNIGLTNFPSCNAYEINGVTIQGQFYCETSGRNVLVRGLSQDIPAAQQVGISVAMINPPYSGTTGTFTLALLRDGTNVIYDVKTGVPGVTIDAGLISNILLSKADPDAIQSLSKTMDYTLDFQLTNPLGLNAVIAFEFPPSFLIDTSAAKLRYIQYGLEDPSESSVATIAVSSSNVLTITNFEPFDEPQMMSLYLRLVNPDNVGETTPVNIRSYLDSLMTILVDEDTSSAYTVIEDITSPATHLITTSTVQASATALGTIEFQVVPTVSIPATGSIVIRIPDGFTIGTLSASSCRVTSNSAGTYVNSGSCSNVGNKITIVLPATVSFPLNYLRKFSLVGVITTPVLPGTFLFDIETYQNDGTTLIETWTDYLIVTPSVFTSPSITTLEKYQGRTTIITGSFTTNIDIPAGITQQKTTDLKGFLEFQFSGTATDLGMGITSKTLIPCYANSGLSPISDSIKCYLTPGSPALIRVEQFEAISAGTSVSISFPNILNPSGTYTVTMKSVQLVNRIRTVFNSYSQSFTSPGTATTLSDTTTTSTGSCTFTSLQVSQSTDITFNPTISVSITGPGYFLVVLPFYDQGWIPSDDSVSCKLGATVFPCVRYKGADWITIRLGSGTSYTSGSTITIQNLQVPRYTNPSVGGITLRYIADSNGMQTIYKTLPSFTAATVPTFTQATLIADNKNKGAVNAQYTIVLVAPNDIPEGASIVIVLPSAYSLLSSSPAVTFSSPDLVVADSATQLSFTASISKLTVTNFALQPASQSFSIVISGLKNPTSLTLSQTWVAYVLYNNNYMVYHNDFDTFTFAAQQTAGTITYNSITCFPENADEDALYQINIVPASNIPVGGTIQITFPTDNYNDLPSPSYVTVSGGITTFSSCTLSGTTYTITLDTIYSSGGIIVNIDTVINPDKGTTSGFVVKTYYDGVMLDNTDTTTLTGRTVTLTDGGDRIIVNSLTCDPQNEGEQSNYTFSFVTSNEIDSTMAIQLIFPPEFDSTLGPSITCDSSSGLIGTISCTASDRTVTVTGFDAYAPDTTRPIIISVYGVVNPNYNGGDDTSQFMIGTLVTGESYFIDYNSAAGSVVILQAPGWATLYNVIPANLYTRWDADYTFNFTAIANIPRTSSDGAILVDFPSAFDIPDGDINCDTLTEDFSPIITCSVARNRVTIDGQTSDYTGNVGFIVRSIQNPIDQGTAQNIVVKTYDGLNTRIIERSYKNLDPFIFTYAYPGPLITVNNDETITTIRGTQTEDIYITLAAPCALNLTLKPDTPGFSIIPFSIDMSLGQQQASFRISVPESFAEGTYSIEWETRGDLIPAYYTPIKKTTVVVKAVTNMVIQAPTLNTIPFGGNSLPSSFTIANGPDIQIQITVNFLITYPGISLSTNTITFEAGQESASFVIYSSSDNAVTGGTKVQKGTLVLSLTGINAGIYELSTSTLDFNIGDTDLSNPEIYVFEATSVTQHTATITVTTNEVVMLYYMYALAGTDIPTLAEVQALGPAPYKTTKSIYGSYQINSNLTATFELSNLVAETPYVLYMYFVDCGANVVFNSTNFTTLDRYNGVDFSMRFLQYDISEAEMQIIINAVSFTLSLFPGKLQERRYVPLTSSSRRMLFQEEEIETPYNSRALTIHTNRTGRMLQTEVFTLMNLQIAASPEYSTYPSPMTLASALNDKVDEVTARLPNSDPDYKIEAFEFTRYQPNFPSVPIITQVDAEWATFTGKLDNYGYIFVVCVQRNELYGTPTPYQILHGFDSRNIENPNGNVEVGATYTNYVTNVTDLQALTNYTAFIIGGSIHPGYPDPMDARQIVAINFTTAPPVIQERLNIKGAYAITVAYQTLAVLMVSLWFLL